MAMLTMWQAGAAVPQPGDQVADLWSGETGTVQSVFSVGYDSLYNTTGWVVRVQGADGESRLVNNREVLVLPAEAEAVARG